MKNNQGRLVLAALAGIVGAAALAQAEAKKCPDLPPCYGVNSCSGKSKCSAKGHSCAGKNACAGQGWLPMPADSCTALTGGSLTPIKAPTPEDQLPGAPQPADKRNNKY